MSEWGSDGDGSVRSLQTATLVGDMLGEGKTPRWLGDPYGEGERGDLLVGPDRMDLPNMAALGR